MLDDFVRPMLERLHTPAAKLIGRRAHPHAISLVGFSFGIACAFSLVGGEYVVALLLWILNRAADGLDGTLARISGRQSDFGGYLDIMLDFVVYAAIPLGLVLGLPLSLQTRAFIPLALLLASFYVNAASWMYPAALVEKRGRSGSVPTSIVMPRGLIEATETVLLYCLLILLPAWAAELMLGMASLVLFTAAQRVYWGHTHLR